MVIISYREVLIPSPTIGVLVRVRCNSGAEMGIYVWRMSHSIVLSLYFSLSPFPHLSFYLTLTLFPLPILCRSLSSLLSLTSLSLFSKDSAALVQAQLIMKWAVTFSCLSSGLHWVLCGSMWIHVILCDLQHTFDPTHTADSYMNNVIGCSNIIASLIQRWQYLPQSKCTNVHLLLPLWEKRTTKSSLCELYWCLSVKQLSHNNSSILVSDTVVVFFTQR